MYLILSTLFHYFIIIITDAIIILYFFSIGISVKTLIGTIKRSIVIIFCKIQKQMHQFSLLLILSLNQRLWQKHSVYCNLCSVQLYFRIQVREDVLVLIQWSNFQKINLTNGLEKVSKSRYSLRSLSVSRWISAPKAYQNLENNWALDLSLLYIHAHM